MFVCSQKQFYERTKEQTKAFCTQCERIERNLDWLADDILDLDHYHIHLTQMDKRLVHEKIMNKQTFIIFVFKASSVCSILFRLRFF